MKKMLAGAEALKRKRSEMMGDDPSNMQTHFVSKYFKRASSGTLPPTPKPLHEEEEDDSPLDGQDEDIQL